MPVTHYDQSAGLSLYVLFNDSSDTAVDLTEQVAPAVREYVASDAAIDAAGLVAGNYSGRVLVGTAAAKSGDDTLKGVFSKFYWDGTVERDMPQEAVDAGGGGTTISVDNVPDNQTWYFSRTNSGLTADNVVQLHSGSLPYVGMSFENVIPEDQDIFSITSVDRATGEATLTFTNKALTATRRKVLTKVTNHIAWEDYTVEFKVVTTNGQTYARVGKLLARNA